MILDQMRPPLVTRINEEHPQTDFVDIVAKMRETHCTQDTDED